MTDQAERLRGLIRQSRDLHEQGGERGFPGPGNTEAAGRGGDFSRSPQKSRPPARVITVTSGKGGVGKSNIALNLAIQFLRRGARTIIIDADFGLANIEVLAGIAPKYHFGDVLASRVTLEEALTQGPLGLRFLSGGSCMSGLAGLGDSQLDRMTESLGRLDSLADVVLIDTGAGIDSKVMSFVRASGETVLVTTPEPTSVTDAYAIVKNAAAAESAAGFGVIVNRAESKAEGMEVFEKLSRASRKFLGAELQCLGVVPNDHSLVRAVKRQEPVTLCYPNAECSRSIEEISLRLLGARPARGPEGGLAAFFRNLCGKREKYWKTSTG